MPIELILASASTARAQLLRQAGLSFQIEPAAIDEGKIKRIVQDRGDTVDGCARALALEKARAVSRRHPDALVIGADQILVAGEKWYDKPADLGAARRQIVSLQGRMHELVTAATVVQDDSELWHAVSRPKLTMRRVSDRFLNQYIDAEGEALLGSVGAYRLEGRGVQLFVGVDGDYFSVLGLPLLELLEFLRGLGAVQE